MKNAILFAALFVMAACASQNVTVTGEINLYEGAAPGSETWDWQEFRLDNPGDGETYIANVTTPTIKAFLPSAEMATGAAMIVCPGGGHQILAYSAEGTNVATWLAEHGVAAFVLKYRLIHFADTPEEAFWYVLGLPEKEMSEEEKEAWPGIRRQASAYSNADGCRAVEYVRAHAAEYGIDPERIGIMGFSAGASVAAGVEFNHTPESCPALFAPIYGGSMQGEMPSDACPLFIAAPQFDNWPGVTGLGLYSAWQDAGLPAEAHYFTDCEHGFGLHDDGNLVNDWIGLLYHFMQKVGFLSPD